MSAAARTVQATSTRRFPSPWQSMIRTGMFPRPRHPGRLEEEQLDSVFIAQAAILLAGSFVQGVTGFAFSLLSLPLLSLLMPAQDAVPMLSLFGLALNVLVLLSAPGAARPLRFLPLYVTGLAFTWPGILLLQLLPDRPVKLALGILVLATAVLYMRGRAMRIGQSRLPLAATGAVSGLLNGLTTFSGPPVVLLLAGTETSKDEFRANLSLYFLVLNVFMVPMLVSRGLLTADLAIHCAKLSPFVVTGAIAGSLASSRIGQPGFRRTVLILLAACGALAAITAVV